MTEPFTMDVDTNKRFNKLINDSEISIDFIKNYIDQIISSRIFYIIDNKKYYSCVWIHTPIVEYTILYPIFQCLSNTMKIEYLPETNTSYGVMSCNWLLGTLIKPTYIKQQPKMLDTIITIPTLTRYTSYTSYTPDIIDEYNEV
jgi:hypothetical protein